MLRLSRLTRLRPRRRFLTVAGLGAALIWSAWNWLIPSSEACTLTKIHDGDTANATCRGKPVKIRLYCIDAPEISQKPWGHKSRDYLREMTPQRFTLRQHEKDRYGRTVGELFYGSRSLNLAMVMAGQAAVYPQYCDESRFFAAQKSAKAARRGIWAKPGLHQRPWEYRAKQRR